MHRNRLFAASALAALSLAACGREAEQNVEAGKGLPDADPAATTATPANEAAAPEFVNLAAANDLFEIEAAKIALARSQNPEVKAFAQMMIDGHAKTTAQLKTAIASSGQTLSPPTTLPEDLQSKLKALQDVDAKDFDKAYMDGQMEAHQTALNLMTRYANDGTAPTLKAFAAEAAIAVQTHLTAARTLQSKLKGGAS